MRLAVLVSPNESLGEATQRARQTIAGSWEPCDVECVRCHRMLCVALRSSKHAIPLRLTEDRNLWLDEHDDCRWCARPISPAGEAKEPLSGYVSFMRMLLGDQSPGRTFNDTIDVAC